MQQNQAAYNQMKPKSKITSQPAYSKAKTNNFPNSNSFSNENPDQSFKNHQNQSYSYREELSFLKKLSNQNQ